MRAYRLDHLSDGDLLCALTSLVAKERTSTAEALAHIAEVDARRLYLPAGFPSMHAYCVGRLRFAEDTAYKRIQVARAARQFPAIFDAIAQSRLHISGVLLLAPHLTPHNANELIGAATHKSKFEISQLLAKRFPRSEVLPLVVAIRGRAFLRKAQLDPDPVGVENLPAKSQVPGPIPRTERAEQLDPDPVPVENLPALRHGPVRIPRSEVKPHAPKRYTLQLTIDQNTYDLLREAQNMLSHQVPCGEVGEVIRRSLELLVRHLEKQKFAATSKPRPRSHLRSVNPRYIPADVKRTVWQRDRGQCTFVSATGHRCAARRFLEFDHIDPVARGGVAMVNTIRLRCRAHNQYEAERTLGSGFMQEKREAAQRAAARARAVEARERPAAKQRATEVITCLRQLRFRADEAHRAAEFCESMPEATVEERVRAALKFLCPQPTKL